MMYDLHVTINAKAYRVEASSEDEARSIVYDECKNHDFLVIESIESEVESVND